MTSQTVAPNVDAPPGEVIGIYDDRQSAQKIRQAIASAGISDQNVLVDDHVSPSSHLEALATTSGPEAGLLIGAFYGGVVGLVIALSAPFVVDGMAVDSSSSRLLILGATVVGALLGWLFGQRIYSAQPKGQKQKSDPSIPRTFRVVVDGSRDEIQQAKKVVRDIEIYSDPR
jgi:hypothetical protein